MHRITFHPLGNADSILLEIAGSKVILVDYAHMKGDDPKDLRYDLKAGLAAKLKGLERSDVDAFCITHLDDDHICGAHDFFYLKHAKAYQGGERIEVKELWVPAGAITEEGCTDDDRIWRAEARHRLREGSGIRVFGRPRRLRDWMERDGIDYASRAHLITDAGQTVPGFELESDEAEFFVHSPFAHVVNEREVEDRNQDCVVLQAVLRDRGVDTKVILAGDAPWEAMVEIVDITLAMGNDHRLDYDVFKIPHHCSYLSLSDEKGETETDPKDQIKDWFDRGSRRCILVSSSWVIANEDSSQPPHFQARNYYADVTAARSGQLKVTMEHPNVLAPEPLVIEIGNLGPTVRSAASRVGVGSTVSANPPKAGDARDL